MYSEQYKAGAPYREDSKFSLKRSKREQIEEEAGSHRGLCTTEPPKEGSGSFFFALAVLGVKPVLEFRFCKAKRITVSTSQPPGYTTYSITQAAAASFVFVEALL
jgi:hypothetical protein